MNQLKSRGGFPCPPEKLQQRIKRKNYIKTVRHESRTLLIIIFIICVLILTSCENFENSLNKPPSATESRLEGGGGEAVGGSQTNQSDQRHLSCKHTDFGEFNNSVQNPREFILNGDIIGGIVPHHMAAATLISGFFNAVAESGAEYDTVVIIAPNHDGTTGDIVVSYKDWQVWDTIYCDRDIIESVREKNPDGIAVTESDDRMEEDHAASVFIPYISHYLPETKVAAFLLSRRLTLENIYNFAKILSDEIKASGKRILFIASIDFSHYLPVPVAIENDRITERAILDRNYMAIQEFSNDYVDSPQALNAFLLYLKNSDTDNIEILYNSNMSEFYGEGINETTSYFIIAAYE